LDKEKDQVAQESRQTPLSQRRRAGGRAGGAALSAREQFQIEPFELDMEGSFR
jgi:hypothetical protein